MLIHLIDGSIIPDDDPLEPYKTVNHELAMHSESLAKKHQLIVINKMDIPGSDVAADRFVSQLEEKNVLYIWLAII